MCFSTYSKILTLLGSVKDELSLRKPGVYQIPCQCDKSYIGETVCTVEERCREHKRNIKLQQITRSAVADRCIKTGHTMEYENTKVLRQSFWDCVTKEDTEIRLQDGLINKDSGLQLNQAWLQPCTEHGEEKTSPQIEVRARRRQRGDCRPEFGPRRRFPHHYQEPKASREERWRGKRRAYIGHREEQEKQTIAATSIDTRGLPFSPSLRSMRAQHSSGTT